MKNQQDYRNKDHDIYIIQLEYILMLIFFCRQIVRKIQMKKSYETTIYINKFLSKFSGFHEKIVEFFIQVIQEVYFN